ncbi:XRE family transcriptional regulator [Dyella solisilvae]|uniref:XRE family transcriptional regulator n=1 Tax=Dyella solisilvae TaxID=1920168 RepID=A0A370K529_9GAMM|nr:XRE family transcriptional regulator [Dyella solisilvae]
MGSVFGEVLTRHRTNAGISQEELALRADVDRTFVSRLERGIRQPTITTLFAIAQALDVQAADLVRETEHLLRRKSPAKKNSP